MEMAKEQELILVIDYGSQYNQLITRRIRELGVYSELHNPSITIEEIKELEPKGIILSGGPRSVYAEDAFTVDPAVFDLGVPVLGICYGMQLMMQLNGGEVVNSDQKESGVTEMNLNNEVDIFKGWDTIETVLMSHGDKVTQLGDDFSVIAQTNLCPNAAVKHDEKPFYGVQFHPESKHTHNGEQFLKNFIRDICDCTGEWTMDNFIDIEIDKIREQVGDKKVLCAMSGGVDSSVTAVLLHRAIGDQLTCIFVDHGLLRKGEADMVMEQFGEGFNMNIIKVDAKEIGRAHV